MSLGTANNEQLVYNYGKATSLETQSVGANWSFSPVCDPNHNKRNPLINVRGISDGPDYRDQHIVTTNNTASLRPIPTIRTVFLALSVHKKHL